MRVGAVTRAAAVYHGCRGGRGGCLILQRAHKKRTASLHSVKEQLFTHHLQWVFTSLFLRRSVLCCSGIGCAAVREGQAETVSRSSVHCSGAWCGPCTAASWSCAGDEKQGGCTAGGFPSASRLLKEQQRAISLAIARCYPSGPGLISVPHCLLLHR